MENKICSSCRINKSISEFHKNSSQKDGYKHQCKECVKNYNLKNKENQKEYSQKYWILNNEKLSEKHKNYYTNNKEKILKTNNLWRENNLDIEAEKERLLNYRINNQDKISKQQKIWRDNNQECILKYSKNYRIENKFKINTYFNYKYNNDSLFKLKVNIRNAIRKSIKVNGYSKNSKTVDILECSFEDFKEYLESKFESWMNWDNHGLYNGELNYGWDIDHIIPISSAKTEVELLKLNHFSNLQPLCSHVNRDIKKSRIL